MHERTLKVKSDTSIVKVSFEEIQKSPNQKNLFYFKPIGREMDHSPDSIDALDTISKFNKAELYLLNIINKEINLKNLQVTITKSNYILGNQRKISSAIKSWTDKKLIKRIKREHYMISPYFFTPPRGTHEIMLAAWEHINKND